MVLSIIWPYKPDSQKISSGRPNIVNKCLISFFRLNKLWYGWRVWIFILLWITISYIQIYSRTLVWAAPLLHFKIFPDPPIYVKIFWWPLKISSGPYPALTAPLVGYFKNVLSTYKVTQYLPCLERWCNRLLLLFTRSSCKELDVTSGKRYLVNAILPRKLLF